MRVVIQRVSKASVTIDNKIKSSIEKGLLILLGIENEDYSGDNPNAIQTDIEWLCKKIVQMRIFEDEAGKMNLSLQDIGGDAIVVSQFTLHASTKKGNRPSFIKAARPEFAVPIYEKFVAHLQTLLGTPVGTGEFGAMMDVALVNDGPVTITMDTKHKE